MLASRSSWAGQFESHLVAMPKDRFFHEMSHLSCNTAKPTKWCEPRHDKTYLWEFPTRPDTNRPAHTQKLARVLKFRIYNLVLSKQRTTKVLIRLRRCAGWSAPLLFAYDIRHIFSWPGSCVQWRHSVKFLNIQTPDKWLYHGVMSPKVADGMAFSVDPDQTVRSGSTMFAQTCLSANLGSLQ